MYAFCGHYTNLLYTQKSVQGRLVNISKAVQTVDELSIFCQGLKVEHLVFRLHSFTTVLLLWEHWLFLHGTLVALS